MTGVLLLVALGAAGAAGADEPAWHGEATALFGQFVTGPHEAERLAAHLRAVATRTAEDLRTVGPTDGVAEAVVRNVLANLRDKQALSAGGPPLTMSAAEIERTVIDFEGFKLARYVTSGVFPKRYFGYFDGKYDTAAYERRLRTATERASAAINAYQKARHNPLRVTAIEIAVTFIAEGGALFLRERQDLLEALHPVLHVGLDDLASGFATLPGLQDQVDRALGTQLGNLVGWAPAGALQLPEPSTVPKAVRWLKHANGAAGPNAYLRRLMTFEEAIAGTALMYLWEKEIAARKVATLGERPLHERPLDEQFILSSLVYNSGNLHTPARWAMIRAFSAGPWLAATSERNAQTRWRLNVAEPKTALAHLREGLSYPEQPTAWLAAYHVLQRYGAFVALRSFTDVFDAQGAFAPVAGHDIDRPPLTAPRR